MPTYREFPEIEIPDFLQGADWHDMSYGNDVNPHSVRYLTSSRDQDFIMCWVAEANAADREYPDAPRFCVQVVGHEDDFNSDGYLCHTDSEAEVRAVIARAVAAFETGGRAGLQKLGGRGF